MGNTNQKRRRRAGARGFTLIELMVSLSAGLIVSGAAFLMARNATTFFKGEAGIGQAQFAGMVGLTRLQADMRRAGFKSTPNVIDDPMRCGSTAGWPNGMREIAALRIENGGSVARHAGDHVLSGVNGLSPDAVIVAGMFGSTEHFSVQAISAGAGGWDILLQNDGALTRTRLASPNPATMLDRVFVVGRYLRLVDFEGREAWGIISGLDMSGTFPRVSVAAAPAMPVRETAAVCGCSLPCVGALVNPVTRMLYDLRAVTAGTYPQYAGLYDNSTHGLAAYHKGQARVPRTELIRVELDATDAEIPGTLAVLAEHAVDFKFGLTEVAFVNPSLPPTITRHAIGSAGVYAAADTLIAGGTPERIRAVQVRLSTRVALRDRNVAIPNPASGGVFRFALGPNRGFARVRTVVAEMQTPNLNGVSW